MIPVCSLDGEKSEVILDLSWNNYFFKPIELRGSITTADGLVYISETDIVSSTDDNFFELLKRKWKNEETTTWFIIPPHGDLSFFEFIYLFKYDFNFTHFGMSIVNRKEKFQYYGPADQEEHGIII